ncbi:MAG: DUF4870 domain-containing protein, partial [Planctomycetes bacterium]|nr:DUF4870 domain-containing protein [Planctomycetota bacterium]
MDERVGNAAGSAGDPVEDAGAAGAPPGRERRAAALAHASALLMFFLPFGNLLGPLLAFAAARGRRPFLARHAAQAVAYQAAVCAAAWTLFVLGETRGFGANPH